MVMELYGIKPLEERLADEIRRLQGENERLRAALDKIANEAYDKADERVRWEQPTMIWQSVAKIALGLKPAKP